VVSKQPPKASKTFIQPVPDKNKVFNRKSTIFVFVAIALTAIVYGISLKNGWIKNWDDGGYVTEHEGSFTFSKDLHKLILLMIYKNCLIFL